MIKGGSDRVMEVKSAATVKLVGLEITKGHTPDGGFAPSLYTENVVGGGIWAEGATSGSEVILTHVTIAGNGLGAGGPTGNSAVPDRGGCCGERGLGAGIDTGGRYDNGSAVFLKNSIVANNGSNLAGDANCYQRYFPTYTDIVDQGGNVTWNDTTCPGKVADPLLGALANNGGLTETVLPGAGGSAIGAVPAGSCTVHEDQRGLPRPGAGKANCDAGAIETQAGNRHLPPEAEMVATAGRRRGKWRRRRCWRRGRGWLRFGADAEVAAVQEGLQEEDRQGQAEMREGEDASPPQTLRRVLPPNSKAGARESRPGIR